MSKSVGSPAVSTKVGVCRCNADYREVQEVGSKTRETAAPVSHFKELKAF